MDEKVCYNFGRKPAGAAAGVARFAGAEYIRQQLGIEDEDIINAVRYHTVARAGMSRLEQIIYLADLTSSERDYPDVERMRRLSDRSLRKECVRHWCLQYQSSAAACAFVSGHLQGLQRIPPLEGGRLPPVEQKKL